MRPGSVRSEEDTEDVNGPGSSAEDLGCSKAELNPTVKSPFPVQPAPFVENGHQPLPRPCLWEPRTPTWAPEPHGAISTADPSPAGPIHELGQPANAAHEETCINIEEDDAG